MFKQIKLDVDAVLARDPAAHSRAEVFLCYPGIRAMFWYRIAHKAYLRKHFLFARYISSRARHHTGIEIHPGATIGNGLFIDHGSGVVIGETAVVGDNVTLYQGVTLGGTGKDTGKRHPTILSGVTIGAGAKILGPITLGERVKVGAGSIVLKDVPANCTVVGNPGRVVKKKQPCEGIDLDQVNLPDPMQDRLENLVVRLTALENSIRDQACRLGYDTCPLLTKTEYSSTGMKKKETQDSADIQ